MLWAPLVVLGAGLVAASAERVEVAVDWSGIADATLERCALRGVESYLLEGLVEVGYAVVRDAGERGIGVRLFEEPGRIVIAGTSGPATRRAAVEVGAACDSSVMIELSHVLRELVDALVGERPAPARQPVASKAVLEAPAAPSALLRLAVVGVVASGRSALGALRAVIDTDPAASWSFGATLEAGATGRAGLLVGEAGIGAVAAVRLLRSAALRVSTGAELLVLAHLFRRDDRESGANVGGRLAFTLDLTLPASGFGAVVAPFVRLPVVRHEAGARVLYDARELGVFVGITHELTLGAGR